MIAFIVGLVVMFKWLSIGAVIVGIPLALLAYFGAPRLYTLMLCRPKMTMKEARADMDPEDWVMGSFIAVLIACAIGLLVFLVHMVGADEIAKQAAKLN